MKSSKTKTNPNSRSANLYDLLSDSPKGEDITTEELSFIGFLAEPGSRILDVGAGTGRHTIPLLELGYKVTAIDSSKGMLEQLEVRSLKTEVEKNLKILHKDILNKKFEIRNLKFEIIVLFWNSFNEIALTKKDALYLLKKLKDALTPNGKILINIDDPERIDPSKFNFSYSSTAKEFNYTLNWSTHKYFKKTNTSISKEEIIIEDKKTGEKRNITSFIKQRYWSLNEIKSLCRNLSLNCETKDFRTSDELYIIISL